LSDVSSALWITGERPDPRLSGGNIRQHHMLLEIASRVPTDLVLAGEEVMGGAPIESALRSVHVVPAPLRQPPLPRLPAWGVNAWLAGPGGPRETWMHAPTRAAISRFLEAHGQRWDVIFVEHAFLAPLGPSLRQYTDRLVLTFQNLTSTTSLQQAAVLHGRRKWLAQREAVTWKRVERQAARDFDLVVTVSDSDAELLASPSIVVPNGVDTSRFAIGASAGRPGQVLFLGHLNYPPNVDGLRWLADEIWPLVIAGAPQAQLEVVGRTPHAPARDAVARVPGAQLHADVPSVDEYLERATVTVVPLRFGTGTRLKALESLAAGIAVVGTTIGLEGLGIVDGTHALVRDTAEGLADALVTVLNDPELRRSLAENGQALARAHFDWKPLSKAFADAALGPVG
jgi:glycosyltransferase involved in cell wall biosynthesis